jgi:hypothetical protein
MLAVRSTILWNALIPKCALRPGIGETHVTYLHPTKGFRRVSNKRLGIG